MSASELGLKSKGPARHAKFGRSRWIGCLKWQRKKAII